MRGKKVKAIKKAAGESLNGSQMRMLKKFNKNNTIPNIKNGNLLSIETNVPVSNKIVNSFFNHLLSNKTVGELNKQRSYGTKSFTQRFNRRHKRFLK